MVNYTIEDRKCYKMLNVDLIGFFGQAIPEVTVLSVTNVNFTDSYLEFTLTSSSKDQKDGGFTLTEVTTPVVRVEHDEAIEFINSKLLVAERVTEMSHDGTQLIIFVEPAKTDK